MGLSGDGYTAHSPMGDWLSWLERTVHIREVTGSNPVSPTTPLPPAPMPEPRVPYPAPERIAGLMADVGLAGVEWRRLAFGMVTIHVGRRA